MEIYKDIPKVMNYGLGGTIQGHLDTSVTYKDSYGDIR